LHEDCRPKIVLRVPPVRGASGHARSAEDAFVESIKNLSVFLRLEVFFLAWSLWSLSLKIWINRLILSVKVRQINAEVF
jgi:hypothetical protein